jgi:hypothetical protein
MEASVFFFPAVLLLCYLSLIMLALQDIICYFNSYQGQGAMNNKVYGELDGLYDSFTGLTADRQRAVVEVARSLLEAQREIESLLKNTGAKSPLPAGIRRKG